MSELQITATLRIHPGKLDAFNAAAADCLRSVREKDSGTLQYDWFLSEDGSECVVRERYRDSDAVLEHIDNLGESFGNLLATCDIAVDVFGAPSAELLEATAAIPVRVYGFYQGL